MRDAILRSRVNEEKVHGLLIINARYGNLEEDETGIPAGAGHDEYPPYIDVTDQLQFQVLNSRLHLPPVSKSTLDGFYDPCPGEEKSLLIIYRFLNTTHRVEVHDEDELEIPSEEDRMGGEEPTTDDQYEEDDEPDE
jgi:DnaJ family protein C protein 11